MNGTFLQRVLSNLIFLTYFEDENNYLMYIREIKKYKVLIVISKTEECYKLLATYESVNILQPNKRT